MLTKPVIRKKKKKGSARRSFCQINFRFCFFQSQWFRAISSARSHFISRPGPRVYDAARRNPLYSCITQYKRIYDFRFVFYFVFFFFDHSVFGRRRVSLVNRGKQTHYKNPFSALTTILPRFYGPRRPYPRVYSW